MKEEARHALLRGRLVMLGFGSVGQAILPLLQPELGIKGNRIRIVKTREDETGIAAEFGAEVIASR